MTLVDIWWGMMPFMGLQVVTLVAVYFFPALALWLPSVTLQFMGR